MRQATARIHRWLNEAKRPGGGGFTDDESVALWLDAEVSEGLG